MPSRRAATLMRAAIRAVALLVALVPAVAAAESGSRAATGRIALPLDGPGTFAGVGACASTQCHGAVGPRKATSVLQNEYRTWMRRDPHRKAFASLGDERGRRMAAKLGIASAEREPACLACHASSVPAAQRGAKYDATLEDGVTCEACHGPAGDEHGGWLATHANPRSTGGSHADSLERGLYPLEDPVRRAELCLSCHLGDGRRFVTHRMMAAGHPRLGFELEAFVRLQPAHFEVDADYRSRKNTPSAARTWAVGQAVAARDWLALLADPAHNHDGPWPEFALYDCYSCHQSMQYPPPPGQGGPVGFGVPRPADENLGLAAVATSVIDPGEGSRLADEMRGLRQAIGARRETAEVALQASRTVDAALPLLAGWSPSDAQTRVILERVAKLGDAAGSTYFRAEQRTLAAQAMVAALASDGGLSGGRLAEAQRRLDGLFELTRTEPGFRPDAFRSELAGLGAAVATGGEGW